MVIHGRPNGSHAKLWGRSRVPKPKRRGGCRREVACSACRTATAVTPSRWDEAGSSAAGPKPGRTSFSVKLGGAAQQVRALRIGASARARQARAEKPLLLSAWSMATCLSQDAQRLPTDSDCRAWSLLVQDWRHASHPTVTITARDDAAKNAGRLRGERFS